MIQRSWSNIATLLCVIVAAVVLAVQQALSGAPDVRKHMPDFAVSHNVNYVPLVLLIAAGAVWLLGRRGSIEAQSQPSSASAQGATAPNASQYLNVEDFYRTYDNAFLRETEAVIQTESNKYAPGVDRERYLVRLSSTILGLTIFEYAWWQIGASQLKALDALNVRSRTFDELRPLYNEGAASRPDFYKDYSFEQWLAFLRTLVFIAEAGKNVRITPRAKEFLKYLTHQGYDTSTKTG